MKKVFCTSVLLLASLALVVTAQAKSIEEILKEKGVITAEEYQEAVQQKPAAYIAGKGLTAATADGKYSLRIGGYAQLLYRYTDFDAPGKADQSDFSVRRFKLQLQGNVVSKDFGYKFQADMKNGFTTEDAFFNYRFGAPLVMQVGQYKPPQARQELTSAAKQLFPERSLANDTFNLGRDLGVQAAGSFVGKMIGYRLGLFNGNGPNTSNPDNRHMVAGRLDLNPLGEYKLDEAGWPTAKPLVNIGASAAWEKMGPADANGGFNRDNDVLDVALGLDSLSPAQFTADFGNSLTWLLWTANLNATWQGAVFAAEYYHLNADPDQGSDWNEDGYYVEAGYQILPNTLQLAARYSAIKSDDANASVLFDKAETQFGVNYYFRKHMAKVQTDITFIDDDLNSDQNNTIYRLQAQIYY